LRLEEAAFVLPPQDEIVPPRRIFRRRREESISRRRRPLEEETCPIVNLVPTDDECRARHFPPYLPLQDGVSWLRKVKRAIRCNRLSSLINGLIYHQATFAGGSSLAASRATIAPLVH